MEVNVIMLRRTFSKPTSIGVISSTIRAYAIVLLVTAFVFFNASSGEAIGCLTQTSDRRQVAAALEDLLNYHASDTHNEYLVVGFRADHRYFPVVEDDVYIIKDTEFYVTNYLFGVTRGDGASSVVRFDEVIKLTRVASRLQLRLPGHRTSTLYLRDADVAARFEDLMQCLIATGR